MRWGWNEEVESIKLKRGRNAKGGSVSDWDERQGVEMRSARKEEGHDVACPYKKKDGMWDEGYWCAPVAAEAEVVPPMASPLTTSSTRRLRWRPSAVSLEATGCVLPKPWAVMEDGDTPCSARKSRTESARRSESC